MTIEDKNRCRQHPQEEATLTCGECGQRICTVCMTLTGEGVRCRNCMARLNAKYYANREPDWTREPEQVVIPVEAQSTEDTTPRVESGGPQLIDINPVTGEALTDITYCPRHPKVETGLRCAKCKTAVCPRCMVYTAKGVFCPDCARVAPKPEARKAEPKKPPRDTGFRTYWRRSAPDYIIRPQHYILAIGAAILAALVGGVAWGFIFEVERAVGRSAPNAIVNSIHLVPEFLLGILVGEAVARATKDRRGPGLQLIAVLGVLLSYLAAIATLLVRAYHFSGGSGFPDFGELINATWKVFINLFNSNGGSGGGLPILLFFVIGGVMAWIRLKR